MKRPNKRARIRERIKTCQRLRISFVFGVCIFTASCTGDGVGLTESGDKVGFSGFSVQIQPIFDRNCIRCHSPGGQGYIQTGGQQNNGLNLTTGNSYNLLVDQPTWQLPAFSPAWRVMPGNPSESYLLQKVVSDVPKFESRMPLDGPPYLSDSEIQLITDWIDSGAPND